MRISRCLLILLAARRLRRSLYKIRDSHKLMRSDIPSTAQAPWALIRSNRSDNGFIIMTSFTITAFERLYALLYPAPIVSVLGGRPPTLSAYDQLAMTLFFLHSACSLNQIALLFGCSVSTCSWQIREHVIRLALELPHCEEARVAWPGDDGVEEYATMMKAYMDRTNNPGDLIPGRPFAVMDGCNLRIHRPRNPIVADKFYNMWKAMHSVGNMFVWAPDGTIIHAFYNAVGGLHDSFLANDAYDLIAKTNPQFVVLADSAFGRGHVRVVTTYKQSEQTDARKREVSKQIARVRSAAEWGNASLQSAWLRLSRPLPTNHRYRQLLIQACLHLNNFRARVDEVSQIRTVYDPAWRGNWRYGADGPSGLERYVERLRWRAARREAER
jgi:hypothetical protein